MTNVERIRREIERLRELQSSPIALCDDLLSFIDSLEPESATEDEDLDSAAKSWYDGVKYKSDLSGTPIMAFKAGVKYDSDRVGRLATDMRDRGFRYQLDAYKNGEDCIASYWDGYADCAKAVLRELDKNNK